MGVTHVTTRISRLAGKGRPVEMPYGFARVSFIAAKTVAQVIFGLEDCEPLLGVVALENTGITVDPANRTPRRQHAIPLKARSGVD